VKNDVLGALSDMNRAIDMEPTSIESWHNRGVVLTLANRLDEADACFKRVVELGGSVKPAAIAALEQARKK
jgi:Flp pilus assembly protein TadD